MYVFFCVHKPCGFTHHNKFRRPKKHITLHCDRTDRQILGRGRGRSDDFFCGPDNVGRCRSLSISISRQDEYRTVRLIVASATAMDGGTSDECKCSGASDRSCSRRKFGLCSCSRPAVSLAFQRKICFFFSPGVNI